MNCRKCGAKRITRRCAGVFSCRHCGVQPDLNRLDRGGLPTHLALPTDAEPEADERTAA